MRDPKRTSGGYETTSKSGKTPKGRDYSILKHKSLVNGATTTVTAIRKPKSKPGAGITHIKMSGTYGDGSSKKSVKTATKDVGGTTIKRRVRGETSKAK